MNLIVFLIVLLAVFLNSVAQLALKAAVNRIDNFNFEWSNLSSLFYQFGTNPWLWLGMICYVISFLVWIFVLSKTDVSIAYPLAALGYVITAFMAYFLLGEHITFLRIAGTIVILLGVFMVARS